MALRIPLLKRICTCYAFFIAFCMSHANAQAFKYKTTEASEILQASDLFTHSLPDTMTVWCNDWNYIVSHLGSWRSDFKLKSNNAFLKLAINNYFPTTKYASSFPAVYRMVYDVYGYTDPSDTVLTWVHYSESSGTFGGDTMTVTYNNDTVNNPYRDQHVLKFPNLYKAVIVVRDIFSDSAGYVVHPDLSKVYNQNFQVEGSIVTQRYDLDHYGILATPLTTVAHQHEDNNYLEVFWNFIPGDTTMVQVTPISYELEWTYADDYARDLTTGAVTNLSSSDVHYDFTNNATRVWLDSSHYKIPLTYQSGYVVFRVRAVRPDSVNYKYLVYGDWSSPISTGKILMAPASSYYHLSAPYGHDSLNWNYTVSFAEEGKYKHVVSFYDGLLKNRQSVTRFSSNLQKLLVTQNIYDYEGRPSIKTLPAPVNSRAFSYLHNVDLNSVTHSPYRADDFDTGNVSCPSIPVISPLATNALASVYYSNRNPDSFGIQRYVPDAEGYPLVQSIYEPGYNDRLQYQGGAGPTLQIGNGNYITNYYVGSQQPNLNRLFGSNAGWHSYYTTTVTRDPNQQWSMSIKDYEGKQMASSLIGPGHTLNHALISVDVPSSFSMKEDLLYGTPQTVIGNTKTADFDYFNQASGTDTLQFIYQFLPVPICSHFYLSVKAHYHFDVIDQCGELVASQDSTLGTNGIGTVPPPPYSGPIATFSADVEPYHVHKVLTVDPADISAALDDETFFGAIGSCFLTKNYFIRKSVESRKFPCPADTMGPCAKKKWEMMQELFPKAKYGKFDMVGTSVMGTSNSIFTLFHSGGHDYYRYQDTCTVPSLPDTMTIGGTTYMHLRTMFADSFIDAYNRAISLGDYRIAEDLLPLHPEYCEYRNCFNDTFKEQLLTIPDFRIAEKLHLLSLDSIVAKDPARLFMTYPSPSDSLKTYQGGLVRLDSTVLLQAYCSCSDSVMFTSCSKDMFHSQIATRTLVDDRVKDFYFKQIINMYLENRQRLVDASVASAGNTCTHCALARMTLIPAAVFDPLISGAGVLALDSTALSTFSTFSGTTSLYWLGLPAPALVDSMDSTMTALYDSASIAYHTTDSMLCYGQVDSILARLSNCVAGNPTNAANIRSTLDSLCAAHAISNGNYSPEQIRFAITRNGIPLSDICNPYLVSYLSFPPAASPPAQNCKTDAYYQSVGSFLMRPGVLSAFTSPGTRYLDTLIGFNFPFDVATRALGITSFSTLTGVRAPIGVFAKYTTSSKLLTLYIYNDPAVAGVSTTDTVKVFLRSPVLGNIFATTPGTFTIGATCINKHPQPNTIGLINQYSFVANISDNTGSSVITCDMLGWVDTVVTTSPATSTLAACIPCTQMKESYQRFNDTLRSLGIIGSDHPCYDQMLQSFLNYDLTQSYTTDQYETFIESCAFADSMKMPLYVGYSTFTFGDSLDMAIFIDSLNSVDTDYSFDDCYRDRSGSTYTVCVDINPIPTPELWKYVNFFKFYTGTFTYKTIDSPLLSLQTPNELGFIYSSPSFPFSPADSGIISTSDSVTFTPSSKDIWISDHFVTQTFYDVISTATAKPYRISRDAYNISSFIYTHGTPGAIFVPNYQSTINSDYYKTKKQDYLKYTYHLQARPPYEVLDSIQSQFLSPRISSFATTQSSYTSAFNPNVVTDLYLSDPSAMDSHFDTLKKILHFVADSNIVSPGHIFFDTNKVVVFPTPDSPLIAYRCGDGSYWYRYFGSGDTMYNIYLAFPKYIPPYARSGYVFAGVSAVPTPIVPALGDTNNRFFFVYLQKLPDTSVITAVGMATFELGKSEKYSDVLLGGPAVSSSVTPPLDTFNNCERSILHTAVDQGIINYNHYMDSVKASIIAMLSSYSMDSVREALMLSYLNNEFGYTLYNYDRASNLISTVPPMGVSPLSGSVITAIDTARMNNTSPIPITYVKQNSYNYNTVNQVTDQTTINGGRTRFIYDRAGRLVFSQNANQAATGYYTYNLYDQQNRIIETGQAGLGCPYFAELVVTGHPGSIPACAYAYSVTTTDTLFSPDPFFIERSALVPYDSIAAHILSMNRTDVVRTAYDTADTVLQYYYHSPFPNTITDTQENLRKRVACVKYFDTLYAADDSLGHYVYATRYSYDLEGNVKMLVHDFTRFRSALGDSLWLRFKRVDYDYDLISGKVNMLSYSRGYQDQYYQHYTYDADNRLTKVETSGDGLIWTQDAAYAYYDHGPLGRIDLGDLHVQGIDYAYTIQGWLKAINSDTLNTGFDMGEDGSVSGPINAADAVAQTIDYFTNDYKPITAHTVQHVPNVSLSLYNGNISRQTVAIDTFRGLYKQYMYDQFNRIKSTDYAAINTINKTISGLNDYHNNYEYDLDGNLTSLVRYGNNTGSGAQIMDSLAYYYLAANNDKLKSVTDCAPNVYNNDIRFFCPGGTPPPRYTYDAIGNTTSDIVSNQDVIQWNLYNKVTHTVSNADSSEMKFTYDAMGNRVAKSYIKMTPTGKVQKDDYYVHDAQGNILAMYTDELAIDTIGGISVTDGYRLTEHDIYGSSRIGVRQYMRNEAVIDPTGGLYKLEYQDVFPESTPMFAYHYTGQKQYELTDHLGNVLATVSDQRAGATYTPIGGGSLTPDSPANIVTYRAIVNSAHDYYPFGMYMPGRSYVDTTPKFLQWFHQITDTIWDKDHYHYGYNGQMKDNEIAGWGNHYSALYWEYDPRIGRRWNQDPISYPWESTYSTFSDNPILYCDVDGDEPQNKGGGGGGGTSGSSGNSSGSNGSSDGSNGSGDNSTGKDANTLKEVTVTAKRKQAPAPVQTYGGGSTGGGGGGSAGSGAGKKNEVSSEDIARFKNQQWVNDMYHLSTGRNLTYDILEGHVPSQSMDVKARINATLNQSSPAFWAGAPQTIATSSLTFENTIEQGTYSVYQGFNKAGEVEYIGITGREPSIRFSEHLRAIGTGKELLQYRVVPGASKLTKMNARILEQTLINQKGLNNLLNKRNSIAPKFWEGLGIK